LKMQSDIFEFSAHTIHFFDGAKNAADFDGAENAATVLLSQVERSILHNRIIEHVKIQELKTACALITDDNAVLIASSKKKPTSSLSKEGTLSKKDEGRSHIGIKSYGLGWQVLVQTSQMQTYRYAVKNAALAMVLYDRSAI